ncbi:hypothetical protein CPB83DRAFT_770369 [Crepidotus variabilis]|uniref:Uncharacterized protein n=1 Tax=Crepidotus variabilis TaxID=179855 RepID=A0A9P6EC96_9AGAR|nr:hypothetical protein CPB83DRAFT_770369 [Crepidotus variabilis]
MFSFATALIALVTITIGVHAEHHNIRVINKCGRGTPYVMAGGKVLLKGEGNYGKDADISSAIAFLDTNGCYPDGLNCMTLETTLVNGRSPGCPTHDPRYPCVSSTDLSLIRGQHRFNVPYKFWYEHGCDGAGHECEFYKYHQRCEWTFYQPNDNQVQVQCPRNNVRRISL